MKNLFFLTIVCLFLAACSQGKSHSDSTLINAEAESGAVDVEKIYGGHCTYLFDTASSGTLTITLSHSDSIQGQNPNKFFADVAEAFCKKLKKSKDQYHILVVLFVYKNKSEVKRGFLMESISLSIKKRPFINRVIELIKSKKYDKIDSVLNSHVLTYANMPDYSRSRMLGDLKAADSLGVITDFYPYDFWAEHMSNGTVMFEFIGVINRMNKNYDFNILIDADNKKDIIYMIINKPEGFYSHVINYQLTKAKNTTSN